MTLVRVVAPHFVAGFLVYEDRVVKTAPILRWMKGMRGEQSMAAMERKGWTWEVL